MSIKLSSILDVAKIKGLEYLELYNSKVSKSTLKVFEGQLEQFNTSSEMGLSLKGSFEGKIGYAYTEKMDATSVEQAIDMVIQYANNSSENSYLSEKNNDKKEFCNKLTIDEVEPVEIKDILLKLERYALSYYEQIDSVSHLEFTQITKDITLMDTAGMNISENYGNNILSIGIIAKQENDTKTLYTSDKVKSISYEGLLPLVEKICLDTINLLGAKKAKTGRGKAILHSCASAEIFSAIVPVFSAMNVMKKISRFKDKLGVKVAVDKLSIVDNSLDENGYIRRHYDDEGSLSKETFIIKEGLLTSFMHNNKTARQMETSTSSNGYKASHKNTVGITPTNMKILSGDTDLHDMILKLNDGVIITDVQGLHAGVNPVSGDISLSCSGYIIEEGKLTRPFSNSVISGNFYEIINNILEISDDTYYYFNGDYAFASPSILIDNMSIAGE